MKLSRTLWTLILTGHAIGLGAAFSTWHYADAAGLSNWRTAMTFIGAYALVAVVIAFWRVCRAPMHARNARRAPLYCSDLSRAALEDDNNG